MGIIQKELYSAFLTYKVKIYKNNFFLRAGYFHKLHSNRTKTDDFALKYNCSREHA